MAGDEKPEQHKHTSLATSIGHAAKSKALGKKVAVKNESPHEERLAKTMKRGVARFGKGQGSPDHGNY